jgi:hypothetical protein
MAKPPIVMQTLWRARGTYIWSLFRKNPRIRAYDEPLHEGLASRTDQQWYFDFKFGGTRTLRHPTVDRHYFSEYPLRPQGGVPLFKASFSFEGFIHDETGEDPCLAAYLRSLVDFAAERNQQAYLRFTRGGLRASLIQRILGGTQIYLNRPASELMASYWSFGPRSYFISVLAYLTVRYSHHPFCASAAYVVKSLGPFDCGPIDPRLGVEQAVARSLPAPLNQRQAAVLVATFWLAYLLEGLAVADCVIDTERLASDTACRKAINDRLIESLGPDAFRDFQAPRSPIDVKLDAAALRGILRSDQRLSALAGILKPRAFETLGDASRRLLDSVL